MAENESGPAHVTKLAARLGKARKETVDAVAHPTEQPVFRTREDGTVLLRDGRPLKETP